MSICGACFSGPDCVPQSDLDLYSLDRTVFPFVLDCPTGDCFGVSLGAGVVSLVVCNQTISRNIPAGTTLAQWQAIIADLLAEALRVAQFCPTTITDGNNTIFLYFNDPQTCTSYCPDGLPFSYTVPAGLFLAFTKDSATLAAYTLACARAKSLKICLSSIPTTFCGGSPLSLEVFATGAIASFPNADLWDMVDGTLPNGVTFPGGYITGGTAPIIGVPTSGGIFTFTIRVSTLDGRYQQKTYTIRVLNINTPTVLASGANGTPYSQTLSETGGNAPINWQVASGSLPTGLTLNQTTGVISGTPTVNGTYNFTVTCQDSST